MTHYTRTPSGSALPIHSEPMFADIVIAWAKTTAAARKVAALAEAYNEVKAEGGFQYGEE